MRDEDVLDAYPREAIDHDTKHQFRGFFRHKLVLNRCHSCRRWHQPPRPCCPDCWSFDLGQAEVSGRGSVYSGVRLHQGPPVPETDYTQPYTVVTVELEEQSALRFTAPLVDHDGTDVPIGMPVSLTWIERAGVPYPAFRPRTG